MTEKKENSQFDLSIDPQLRCLALTEKIISSLNDPEIKKRYFNLKEKLLGSDFNGSASDSESQQTSSDKSYAFYQSLAQENQRLKDQLAEITLRKPDFSNDPENEVIAGQIRELERKILPTHPLPPCGNAVQELENLKKVISAKLDSLDFVRDKLRTENQRLKNDYREISQNLAKKIEAAKEKEDIEHREIASQERALSEEIRKAQQELDSVTEKYRIANEENSKIRQKLNETLALQENIQKDSTETEKMISKMEEENANLFTEIEQLKTKLNIKTKELKSLQTLQKFGVEVSDDVDISEEILKLTRQRDSLKSENAQLSFDLKRMENYPTIEVLPSTETISLDEDELAAQILNSKWH
ncbi:hypothetical protein TRFO_41502 [Tritrichomonas foetus]|uniref:Uncharacterized protein n=1 Tax=Tritrichomonas foetus TaxID=1144522 RepID=A0A1J4L0E2_9EUKA|nr:hypothetical protein TRFO_41502 [Tritrichomonas foetus]|eukprot:OHT16874.1 hypothetical protein TRFO_41502 [Tritrichomonas foetus]